MKTYSERLNKVIPGGAHTYSRGDDQFPQNAPQILSRGKGAYVWGPQDEKLLDYGMALRAVTLGYAQDEVNRAAVQQIENGNNLTRASLIELEAAELFSKLIPSAEMIKFAKNGSSATSAAVKLARAFTGKDMVARCSQHPFFSYDDWFIGDTVIKKGVPEQIGRLTVGFNFNDIASLEKVFQENSGKISCVILEPAATDEPRDNFLQKVKSLCEKHSALFILDEMITGFRWHLQGAHTYYGVVPDLITFGKAMANGFSVAAVAGRADVMDIGGIKNMGAERVFLMSSTHGAEMCGLGALVKTIEIYKRDSVIEHLWKYGNSLIKEANLMSQSLGIGDYFQFGGVGCSPYYITKGKDGAASMPLRTLFSQEMIKNGVLMPWVALSYAHRDGELNKTMEAMNASLKVYAQALEKGWEKYLIGEAIRPVFRGKN